MTAMDGVKWCRLRFSVKWPIAVWNQFGNSHCVGRGDVSTFFSSMNGVQWGGLRLSEKCLTAYWSQYRNSCCVGSSGVSTFSQLSGLREVGLSTIERKMFHRLVETI